MKLQDQPLVSIVTPVYNGALYFRECIESVLSQTYTNWEYTILNNHSTDETLKIAEEYARKDKRIRVFSNDTLLDIISNHNKAFSLMSPESRYCKVVSADDWLLPDCLTRMVNLAEANPSIGIVGSYQLSGSGPDWKAWRVKWTEIPYANSVTPGREACRVQMLTGVYVFGTPTSILYRADLVRREAGFYPNSTAEADTSACYKALKNADFGFVHQVLSYERVHEKSMSATSRSLNSYESSRLSDVVEYGSFYLTKEEQAGRIRQILRGYYRYLAVSAIRFRGRTFWEYHRRRLREAGYPFSPVRLGIEVLFKIGDLLLNPKRTIEKAVGRAKT